MGPGFVSAGATKWNDCGLWKCASARVFSSIPEVSCLFCFLTLGNCCTLAPVFSVGVKHHHLSLSQQDKNIQAREGKLEADARYETACNRLANKAVQRGSADNVTVMVVRIKH